MAAAALGLSLPIGAFLAGLALSGSLYAHQVFAEILPLRDAFVAIFFTSMGTLVQPAGRGADAGAPRPAWSASSRSRAFSSPRSSRSSGARTARHLDRDGARADRRLLLRARPRGHRRGRHHAAVEQAFLGAAVLSMAATPFMMRAAHWLAALGAAEPGGAAPRELRDHVLVIGYGVTGQAVARVLRETGIPFAAVDMVVDASRPGRREGMPVRFGDASRRGVLEEMGAEAARAAVVRGRRPGARRGGSSRSSVS
jgi:CPA2 family monovalent cation:H+ antiporter-2